MADDVFDPEVLDLGEADPVTRSVIERELRARGIVHDRQDALLVIDRRHVDLLLQLVSDLPAASGSAYAGSASEVLYGTADWSIEARLEIERRLDAAGVYHYFDDGWMVIDSGSAGRVDAIIEGVTGRSPSEM